MYKQQKKIIAGILAFVMIFTTLFGFQAPTRAFAAETWAHLVSGANNGNQHFTDDTSQKPEAFVLSTKDNIQAENLSFTMKLASGGASRFRFVTKYVSTAQWGYVAYDGSGTGKWFFEYKNAGQNSYPTLEGLPAVNSNDEVSVNVSYSGSTMTVTAENRTTNQRGTATFTNEAIGVLSQASGKIGFGAGTWGTEYTDVYFKDVKVGESSLTNYTADFAWYRNNVQGQTFETVDGTEIDNPTTPDQPSTPDDSKGRAWWKLVGGNNNGAGHQYGNASVAGPITLLDMSRTTTASGALSFVVKPNTNWGVFYNYVDNDNWLYVGWDTNSGWYFQYKFSGGEEYPKFTGLPTPEAGEETSVSITLDRETISLTVNGETSRVTNQKLIAYAEANATRGRIGLMSKMQGEANAIYFADVTYNGQSCMEDDWQFAAERAGQEKEKVYTQLREVRGSVSANVSGNAGGNAIEGATVRIGLASAKTDISGNFIFPEIEVGSHTLTATKGGYEAYEQEIIVTEDGIAPLQIALTPKKPINLGDYDTIQSDDMTVYVGKEFPLVARYQMKSMNSAFFRGNETDLNTIEINGVAIEPTVSGSSITTDSKTYELHLNNKEASINLNMTVAITVSENTLTWEVTKLEKLSGCAKIATINIPALDLLSVDAGEEDAVFAGAQASTTTTNKADTYITFEDGFRASNRDGYLYAFLSNGNLSAGLFSNSEVEGDKRVIRNNGADTIGLSSAPWYYEMGDKNGQAKAANYDPYPLSELPVAKVAIGADENKDGAIDWNDGALAYRKIMHVAYGSEMVKEQVNNRIVMNFASMAPNPFLATADNIKKVYLATDGLPQAVMLKGYGNEGHDSANSEYADIAEREGGVKDFQELIRIAHDYNTEIGIHVNAQEIYPEAKSFNNAMIGIKADGTGSIGNGWGWLDQSHTIDKLWDLSSQARWKRFVQLYDRINNTDHYSLDWPEAVVESRGTVDKSKAEIQKEAEELPHNMDFIYLDVWYQDAWETRRIAEEINSLGWRFSTEFSAQGEYDSTWQHWSTDAAYGGATAKGFNSDIIRFIRNDQRDSQVLNYPQYGGTADNPLLGGYRLYGFEGWGGDRSFNNYILQTFNQNLPTKFLQHYYVTDWTNYGPGEQSPVGNTEKEIKLKNDAGDEVVVTRKREQRDDDNIERIIKLNNKVVLDDVKYLLPWTDNKTKEVKLYHWNLEGGESEWELPKEFNGLAKVYVYELSDQGRINKQEINVTNNKITLTAKPETAYIVVKGEGVKTLVKPFGESDYVADPGFNGYPEGGKLNNDHWSGDITNPSIQIEKSFTGDQRLAFNSPEDEVTVKTKISNLKPDTHYVAEIYVQNDSEAKAYISVNAGTKKVENYAEESILQNYVKCDNKNGTKMQRIQISFVAETTEAELILTREAGQGSTYMDDIRIVEITLDNWQADGSFEQDFETVVQGLYPFVLSSAQGISDPVTHLSQKNAPFTQAGWNGRVIDDVIEGEWSLKHHGANTGIIYQTLPQNFRFEPGKAYTVEFDYQSGPDKAYAMVIGDGLTYNVPTEDQMLAQARGTDHTAHVSMQVIGSGSGQTWIGLYEKGSKAGSGKMGETDFVLDNLVIKEDKEAQTVALENTTIYLGENAKIYGSHLDETTWESSNEFIATVDRETKTVKVFAKGTVTLTATLPNGEKVPFTIIVKDTKVSDIPREEFEGMTATANTEQKSAANSGAAEGDAFFAVDGNSGTHWHSQYSPSRFQVSETSPAIIKVNLGKVVEFGGFKFQQRSSGGSNGVVSKITYRILAEDGSTVVTEGSKVLTSQEKTNNTWVIAEFANNVRAQYIEISVTEGSGGYAAIAEICPIAVQFLGDIAIEGYLSKTYDGTAVNPSSLTIKKGEAAKDGEVIFSYYKADDTAAALEEVPVNAGEYVIEAAVTVSENKVVKSNKLAFEIRRAPLTIQDAVVEVDESKQGKDCITVKGIELTGMVGDETLVKDIDYTFTYEVTARDGMANVTITAELKDTEQANNYTFENNVFTKSIEVDWITKDITLSGTLDKVYDGKVVDVSELTVDKNGQEGNITYKFYEDEAGQKEVTGTPKNAGTYYVKAILDMESANVAIESNLVAFVILEAGLTIEDVVLEWFVQDIASVPVLAVNHVSFTGLIEGETLTIDVDYQTSVSVNEVSGNDVASVTVSLNSTEKALNYTLIDTTFDKVLEDGSVSGNDPETKGYENIWVEGLTDKVYTGSKITQNLKVYDGDKLLIEGADYTISYKNNVNACEFTDEELAAFEEAYRNDPKTKANIGNIPSKKVPQVVLKMKGNYTGTRSLFFRIEKQDISDEENFIIDDLTVTNTGKNKTPVPVVTWKYNGKNLKNKKDFTVEQSAADHSLVVKGNGNFKGEKKIDYIITPDKNTIAMNQVKVSKIQPVDYKEGESLKPTGFTVKYKKATLIEGTHFEVSEVTAEDIMGSGMATVVLTAKEGAAEAGYSFVGSKRVSFKVNTYAMSKVKASGLVPQTFTGDAINILDDRDSNGNPVVSLTIPATKTTAARTLTEEDYTVTYEKNVVKGTASVTLTGIPERGVTGSKKLTFKINPTTLSKEEGSGFEVTLTSDVSGNDTIVYHTKGGAKPAVIIVREDGQSLVEGRDYTVTYKSNKGPGQGQAVVKGKGNYTGQFNLSYTIEKKPVSEADSNGVWIQVNDKVYNTKKNSWKQNFKVLDSDGKALANKKDADIKGAVYTVISLPANAPENINVGDTLSDAKTVLPEGSEVQITVTLAGSYEGKVTGTYRIIHKEKDISKAKFQLNPQQYTGEAVIIDSNDDFKKRDLKGIAISMEEGEGQIFEVVEGSYSNNLKKGTAKVTLRGVGEYGGIKTVTFKIGARSVTDWFDSEFIYW